MTDIETGRTDAPSLYVSEHFLMSDFICPCCDRLKIVPAFYRHVGLLEALMSRVGFPLVVTSGYRCGRHNRRVGGSAKSWHLLFATDVAPEDGGADRVMAIYEAALDSAFGGIGRYDGHVHLDLRPERLIWRG